MHIRKANINDLAEIMEIYKTAQEFMIDSGNPYQWGRTYPSRELIEDDIARGVCHLICDNEMPHGVFALFEGQEPTYEYIENGCWANDDEYVTVHRIASDGKLHGIFNCAIEYCKSRYENIRIDTHESNIIMQGKIEKSGFERCGTIYVADGSARIAYQWCKK